MNGSEHGFISYLTAYFRYIGKIAATLSSDVIDENEVEIYSAMSDDFARYIISFEALEDSRDDVAELLISRLEPSSPYYMHIEAKILMKLGRFEEAYTKLYAILTTPVKIQEPLMYFVFCDLEISCKERGDFKGAYEYANDKLELLQKMLNISRQLAYELITSGSINAVKVGNSYRIPKVSVIGYMLNAA